MESEINIENLPDHILEEIFSYIPKKKKLRLVSKRFWDIVNFSQKLMSNFTLNVRKIIKEDINNIRGHYKNLYFSYLDYNCVKFVTQYNYKQFVKNIHFDIQYLSISDSDFEWIKSILLEFGHLLDVQMDFRLFFPSTNNSPDEFRNIRSFKTNNMNVLPLFRNAPNLKKLNIENASGEYFTQPINWKLKELHINYLDYSNMDAFVKFLEAQSSTLTTLKINKCSNILNDIVHKLPNLEVLHLQVSREDYINDEWLLPIDKLKELAIVASDTNGGLLEQILKHYRNIEKLYINVFTTINVERELRLKNIKHLTVTEESFGVLKYLRSDNLKSLTLIGEIISKFDDIPKDILSKVETLKVNHMENMEFLTNFPALSHLYLISMFYISEKEFEILLSNVLSLSNVKYLTIHKKDWKFSVSPQEFLIQKGHPDTIINLHHSNYDMLDETDVKIMENEENLYHEYNYYCHDNDDLDSISGYDS